MRAMSLEYRLEIVDGYVRPVFDGRRREWSELIWELLLPFPALAAAMLEEVERVRGGVSEGWVKETPEARITCGPRTLTLEENISAGPGREAVRIELPLREAVPLMWRWVFECAWRESQAPGRTGG